MYSAKPVIAKLIYQLARLIFSARTVHLMHADLVRLRTRLLSPALKSSMPHQTKLHLGCGLQCIPGWLNIDLAESDCNVDLAKGRLPWESAVFDVAVGRHVIEHLELLDELMPLLRELRRVMKTGGKVWLSCPDIEKLCRSYLNYKMVDLLEDRKKRFPQYSLGQIPPQHLLNDLFHQCSEPSDRYGFKPLDQRLGVHKNLFDFELLKWALEEANFSAVKRVVETDLLNCFPEFPPRNDDAQSIYVYATAS